MKRRRTHKMTTSELLAAGHIELALHLRQRLQQSIENRKAGIRLWRAKKHIKPENRFVTP